MQYAILGKLCIDTFIFYVFQPKQRTSLISSQEVYRPSHVYDQSEVSSSAGYASVNTTPPISPANYSIGSMEGSDIIGKLTVVNMEKIIDCWFPALCMFYMYLSLFIYIEYI